MPGESDPAGVEQEANLETYLEQVGQLISSIILSICSIFVLALSGHTSIKKFNHPLSLIGFCAFFVAMSLSCILAICRHYITCQKQLNPFIKMMTDSLTLLIGVSISVASAVILVIISSEYISLTTILLVGCIVILMLLYFGWNQEEPTGNIEYYESILKNGFKLACFAIQAGFLVEIVIVTLGYLRNPNFPADHSQYDLIVPYLAITVGAFAATTISSSSQFKRDPMVVFVKYTRKIILFSLGTTAWMLAAEFIDTNQLCLALIIATILEFIIQLLQKAQNGSNGELIELQFDLMHQVAANAGLTLLSAMYSVMFGSKGYDLYILYSVFFLFLAIVSSMMRMALPLRETKSEGNYYKTMEIVINALPLVEIMVSLALLLIYINLYVIE